MKDTIKSKDGYRVFKVIKKNDNFVIEKNGEVLPSDLFGYCNIHNFDMNKNYYIITDGNKVLFIGEYMNFSDYLEDCENNEGHNFCEKFTTISGQEFIYFRDEEIDVDYITKISANYASAFD